MTGAGTVPQRLAAGQHLFVWLQYLLPQHTLSRIVRRRRAADGAGSRMR